MDDISQAGGHAVEEVSGAFASFMEWIKGFLTWDNLFKLIGILVILLIMWIVYKIITRSVKKIPEEKLSTQRSMIIQRIIRYAFFVLVAMYILSLFGIKLSAIWGAAGVAGIAVAFAAQTSVSNIISGFFVIAEKALKIGDLINVAGETGIVDSIGLLSIKVHTLDNQMIRIPNSTIINSNLRNTSYFNVRRLNVEVSVAYNTDLQNALDTLLTAPALCKNVLKDPAPVVWIDGFGESGVQMTLAVWFKSENFFAAKNESFIAVKKVFDDSKIEIPYNKLVVKIAEDGPISMEAQRKAAETKRAVARNVKKIEKSIDRTVKTTSKKLKEMIAAESAKLDDK